MPLVASMTGSSSKSHALHHQHKMRDFIFILRSYGLKKGTWEARVSDCGSSVILWPSRAMLLSSVLTHRLLWPSAGPHCAPAWKMFPFQLFGRNMADNLAYNSWHTALKLMSLKSTINADNVFSSFRQIMAYNFHYLSFLQTCFSTYSAPNPIRMNPKLSDLPEKEIKYK